MNAIQFCMQYKMQKKRIVFMKEKSEQQKMDALYGIRFIAALAVVCFHYNGFTGTGHDDVELPFYSILKYFYRGGVDIC